MTKEDKRKVLAELDELARGTSGVVRGTVEDCKRAIEKMPEMPEPQKEKPNGRLTTDKPETNLESALNMFYAKDGEAWVRGGGEEPEYKDVTLFDYIRAAIRNTSDENVSGISNEDLAEVIYESWLFDGNTTTEGLIATLYTAAWAFAEIRERLKLYEDREKK